MEHLCSKQSYFDDGGFSNFTRYWMEFGDFGALLLQNVCRLSVMVRRLSALVILDVHPPH